MALDLARIWNGLYSQLTSASAFNTTVGGRVYYGHSPERATMPYAVVNQIDKVPVDTFDSDGYRIRWQIALYSPKASGSRAATDVADDLRVIVHKTTWAVAGHEQMKATVDIERGPFRESELWRYDVDIITEGFDS